MLHEFLFWNSSGWNSSTEHLTKENDMAVHYDITRCGDELESYRNTEDGDVDGLFLFCVTMMVTGTGELDSEDDVKRFLSRFARYLVACGDDQDKALPQMRWARGFANAARGIRVNVTQEPDEWFERRLVTWIDEEAIRRTRAMDTVSV
jgi:hypothetical protein